MTLIKWLKSQSPDLAKFSWQGGYGAFSVSESNLVATTAYIQNQREHHRTKSFKEEFRDFLTKNNIPFDENHVWDVISPNLTPLHHYTIFKS